MASIRIGISQPDPVPTGYAVRFRLKGSSDLYVTVSPIPYVGGYVLVTHPSIVFGQDYEGCLWFCCSKAYLIYTEPAIRHIFFPDVLQHIPLLLYLSKVEPH